MSMGLMIAVTSLLSCPHNHFLFALRKIKRLIKEVEHYRQEVTENEMKWKQVEADPTKDEYDAKRFRDIWEESTRMVPDAERRLQSTREELATLVQTYFNDKVEGEQDPENEWLPIAREIIKSDESTVIDNDDNQTNAGRAGGETTNVDELAEGEAF